MEINGRRVSRETMDRLQAFARHFEKWAKAINLVAPSTKSDMWTRHIEDSAQIFALNPTPKTWVDLGSGGGFPGLITAIFLTELSNGWVHLVESNQKKASFLRSAILETGARASVHPIRIEDAHTEIGNCDAVSARALAELDLLLRYSSDWMRDNPACKAYFHKGRDYAREIEAARSGWAFDLVIHTGRIERDSVVLEISNLAQHS